MYADADKRAYDRAQQEGAALGRWPSVYRIMRIAATHGASPWCLLVRTHRLGVEVDEASGEPTRLHPSGRLISLDDTPVSYYRRAVLVPDAATFEALAEGCEPYVHVFNTEGKRIDPRAFKREATREPSGSIAPPPIEEVS